MFSVIIPLYNKEKYICRALESILGQTLQEFEIVVVDDGSTDSGVKMVDSFEDARIRIISQPNQGVSAARNRGISEAKYGFIAFLDADDEWLPDYLVSISQLIEKYVNCHVYATSYFIQEVHNRTKIHLNGLSFDGNDGILDNYFEIAANNMPPLWTSAVCVKKDAIQKIGGFPEGIKSGEDLLTWARLAVNFDIAFSKKPLSIYHNEIQGWEPGRPTSDEDYVGSQLLLLLDEAKPSIRKSLKFYIAHWYAMRASTFIRHNRRVKALTESLKAVRMRFFYPKAFIFMIMSFLPYKLNQYIFKRRN